MRHDFGFGSTLADGWKVATGVSTLPVALGTVSSNGPVILGGPLSKRNKQPGFGIKGSGTPSQPLSLKHLGRADCNGILDVEARSAPLLRAESDVKRARTAPGGSRLPGVRTASGRVGKRGTSEDFSSKDVQQSLLKRQEQTVREWSKINGLECGLKYEIPLSCASTSVGTLSQNESRSIFGSESYESLPGLHRGATTDADNDNYVWDEPLPLSTVAARLADTNITSIAAPDVVSKLNDATKAEAGDESCTVDTTLTGFTKRYFWACNIYGHMIDQVRNLTRGIAELDEQTNKMLNETAGARVEAEKSRVKTKTLLSQERKELVRSLKEILIKLDGFNWDHLVYDFRRWMSSTEINDSVLREMLDQIGEQEREVLSLLSMSRYLIEESLGMHLLSAARTLTEFHESIQKQMSNVERLKRIMGAAASNPEMLGVKARMEQLAEERDRQKRQLEVNRNLYNHMMAASDGALRSDVGNGISMTQRMIKSRKSKQRTTVIPAPSDGSSSKPPPPAAKTATTLVRERLERRQSHIENVFMRCLIAGKTAIDIMIAALEERKHYWERISKYLRRKVKLQYMKDNEDMFLFSDVQHYTYLNAAEEAEVKYLMQKRLELWAELNQASCPVTILDFLTREEKDDEGKIPNIEINGLLLKDVLSASKMATPKTPRDSIESMSTPKRQVLTLAEKRRRAIISSGERLGDAMAALRKEKREPGANEDSPGVTQVQKSRMYALARFAEKEKQEELQQKITKKSLRYQSLQLKIGKLVGKVNDDFGLDTWHYEMDAMQSWFMRNPEIMVLEALQEAAADFGKVPIAIPDLQKLLDTLRENLLSVYGDFLKEQRARKKAYLNKTSFSSEDWVSSTSAMLRCAITVFHGWYRKARKLTREDVPKDSEDQEYIIAQLSESGPMKQTRAEWEDIKAKFHKQSRELEHQREISTMLQEEKQLYNDGRDKVMFFQARVSILQDLEHEVVCVVHEIEKYTKQRKKMQVEAVRVGLFGEHGHPQTKDQFGIRVPVALSKLRQRVKLAKKAREVQRERHASILSVTMEALAAGGNESRKRSQEALMDSELMDMAKKAAEATVASKARATILAVEAYKEAAAATKEAGDTPAQWAARMSTASVQVQERFSIARPVAGEAAGVEAYSQLPSPVNSLSQLPSPVNSVDTLPDSWSVDALARGDVNAILYGRDASDFHMDESLLDMHDDELTEVMEAAQASPSEDFTFKKQVNTSTLVQPSRILQGFGLTVTKLDSSSKKGALKGRTAVGEGLDDTSGDFYWDQNATGTTIQGSALGSAIQGNSGRAGIGGKAIQVKKNPWSLEAKRQLGVDGVGNVEDFAEELMVEGHKKESIVAGKRNTLKERPRHVFTGLGMDRKKLVARLEEESAKVKVLQARRDRRHHEFIRLCQKVAKASENKGSRDKAKVEHPDQRQERWAKELSNFRHQVRAADKMLEFWRHRFEVWHNEILEKHGREVLDELLDEMKQHMRRTHGHEQNRAVRASIAADRRRNMDEATQAERVAALSRKSIRTAMQFFNGTDADAWEAMKEGTGANRDAWEAMKDTRVSKAFCDAFSALTMTEETRAKATKYHGANEHFMHITGSRRSVHPSTFQGLDGLGELGGVVGHRAGLPPKSINLGGGFALRDKMPQAHSIDMGSMFGLKGSRVVGSHSKGGGKRRINQIAKERVMNFLDQSPFVNVAFGGVGKGHAFKTFRKGHGKGHLRAWNWQKGMQQSMRDPFGFALEGHHTGPASKLTGLLEGKGKGGGKLKRALLQKQKRQIGGWMGIGADFEEEEQKGKGKGAKGHRKKTDGKGSAHTGRQTMMEQDWNTASERLQALRSRKRVAKVTSSNANMLKMFMCDVVESKDENVKDEQIAPQKASRHTTRRDTKPQISRALVGDGRRGARKSNEAAKEKSSSSSSDSSSSGFSSDSDGVPRFRKYGHPDEVVWHAKSAGQRAIHMLRLVRDGLVQRFGGIDKAYVKCIPQVVGLTAEIFTHLSGMMGFSADDAGNMFKLLGELNKKASPSGAVKQQELIRRTIKEGSQPVLGALGGQESQSAAASEGPIFRQDFSDVMRSIAPVRNLAQLRARIRRRHPNIEQAFLACASGSPEIGALAFRDFLSSAGIAFGEAHSLFRQMAEHCNKEVDLTKPIRLDKHAFISSLVHADDLMAAQKLHHVLKLLVDDHPEAYGQPKAKARLSVAESEDSSRQASKQSVFGSGREASNERRQSKERLTLPAGQNNAVRFSAAWNRGSSVADMDAWLPRTPSKDVTSGSRAPSKNAAPLENVADNESGKSFDNKLTSGSKEGHEASRSGSNERSQFLDPARAVWMTSLAVSRLGSKEPAEVLDPARASRRSSPAVSRSGSKEPSEFHDTARDCSVPMSKSMSNSSRRSSSAVSRSGSEEQAPPAVREISAVILGAMYTRSAPTAPFNSTRHSLLHAPPSTAPKRRFSDQPVGSGAAPEQIDEVRRGSEQLPFVHRDSKGHILPPSTIDCSKSPQFLENKPASFFAARSVAAVRSPSPGPLGNKRASIVAARFVAALRSPSPAPIGNAVRTRSASPHESRRRASHSVSGGSERVLEEPDMRRRGSDSSHMRLRPKGHILPPSTIDCSTSPQFLENKPAAFVSASRSTSPAPDANGPQSRSSSPHENNRRTSGGAVRIQIPAHVPEIVPQRRSSQSVEDSDIDKREDTQDLKGRRSSKGRLVGLIDVPEHKPAQNATPVLHVRRRSANGVAEIDLGIANTIEVRGDPNKALYNAFLCSLEAGCDATAPMTCDRFKLAAKALLIPADDVAKLFRLAGAGRDDQVPPQDIVMRVLGGLGHKHDAMRENFGLKPPHHVIKSSRGQKHGRPLRNLQEGMSMITARDRGRPKDRVRDKFAKLAPLTTSKPDELNSFMIGRNSLKGRRGERSNQRGLPNTGYDFRNMQSMRSRGRLMGRPVRDADAQKVSPPRAAVAQETTQATSEKKEEQATESDALSEIPSGAEAASEDNAEEKEMTHVRSEPKVRSELAGLEFKRSSLQDKRASRDSSRRMSHNSSQSSSSSSSEDEDSSSSSRALRVSKQSSLRFSVDNPDGEFDFEKALEPGARKRKQSTFAPNLEELVSGAPVEEGVRKRKQSTFAANLEEIVHVAPHEEGVRKRKQSTFAANLEELHLFSVNTGAPVDGAGERPSLPGVTRRKSLGGEPKSPRRPSFAGGDGLRPTTLSIGLGEADSGTGSPTSSAETAAPSTKMTRRKSFSYSLARRAAVKPAGERQSQSGGMLGALALDMKGKPQGEESEDPEPERTFEKAKGTKILRRQNTAELRDAKRGSEKAASGGLGIGQENDDSAWAFKQENPGRNSTKSIRAIKRMSAEGNDDVFAGLACPPRDLAAEQAMLRELEQSETDKHVKRLSLFDGNSVELDFAIRKLQECRMRLISRCKTLPKAFDDFAGGREATTTLKALQDRFERILKFNSLDVERITALASTIVDPSKIGYAQFINVFRFAEPARSLLNFRKRLIQRYGTVDTAFQVLSFNSRVALSVDIFEKPMLGAGISSADSLKLFKLMDKIQQNGPHGFLTLPTIRWIVDHGHVLVWLEVLNVRLGGRVGVRSAFERLPALERLGGFDAILQSAPELASVVTCVGFPNEFAPALFKFLELRSPGKVSIGSMLQMMSNVFEEKDRTAVVAAAGDKGSPTSDKGVGVGPSEVDRDTALALTTQLRQYIMQHFANYQQAFAAFKAKRPEEGITLDEWEGAIASFKHFTDARSWALIFGQIIDWQHVRWDPKFHSTSKRITLEKLAAALNNAAPITTLVAFKARLVEKCGSVQQAWIQVTGKENAEDIGFVQWQRGLRQLWVGIADAGQIFAILKAVPFTTQKSPDQRTLLRSTFMSGLRSERAIDASCKFLELTLVLTRRHGAVSTAFEGFYPQEPLSLGTFENTTGALLQLPVQEVRPLFAPLTTHVDMQKEAAVAVHDLLDTLIDIQATYLPYDVPRLEEENLSPSNAKKGQNPFLSLSPSLVPPGGATTNSTTLPDDDSAVGSSADSGNDDRPGTSPAAGSGAGAASAEKRHRSFGRIVEELADRRTKSKDQRPATSPNDGMGRGRAVQRGTTSRPAPLALNLRSLMSDRSGGFTSGNSLRAAENGATAEPISLSPSGGSIFGTSPCSVSPDPSPASETHFAAEASSARSSMSASLPSSPEPQDMNTTISPSAKAVATAYPQLSSWAGWSRRDVSGDSNDWGIVDPLAERHIAKALHPAHADVLAEEEKQLLDYVATHGVGDTAHADIEHRNVEKKGPQSRGSILSSLVTRLPSAALGASSNVGQLGSAGFDLSVSGLGNKAAENSPSVAGADKRRVQQRFSLIQNSIQNGTLSPVAGGLSPVAGGFSPGQADNMNFKLSGSGLGVRSNTGSANPSPRPSQAPADSTNVFSASSLSMKAADSLASFGFDKKILQPGRFSILQPGSATLAGSLSQGLADDTSFNSSSSGFGVRSNTGSLAVSTGLNAVQAESTSLNLNGVSLPSLGGDKKRGRATSILQSGSSALGGQADTTNFNLSGSGLVRSNTSNLAASTDNAPNGMTNFAMGSASAAAAAIIAGHTRYAEP